MQNTEVVFHGEMISKLRSSFTFSEVQIVKYEDTGFYIRIT